MSEFLELVNWGLIGWIFLACFLVAVPCSQVGTFLLMRKMALVGDAISHSVLPGIVIGFLVAGNLDSPWIIFGASLSGFAVVGLVELIQSRGRVKQDAAIGISFTTLFAVGVILAGLYARRVDLDPDCVLLGQVEYLLDYARVDVFGIAVPRPIFGLLGAALLGVGAVWAGKRWLMVCSFDSELARALGYPVLLVHFGLMALVSLVVVVSFQVVGVVLVVALLIMPGAFGLLLGKRVSGVLMWAFFHATASAAGGVLLAVGLNVNTGGMVVVVGGGLVLLAWAWILAMRMIIKNRG